MRITSFQNPKVKQIKKLRERRERQQTQRFVIDDERDLIRALDAGYSVDYAFYCPALGAQISTLERLPLIYEVSQEIMEKVSYRQNPSGLVAVMIQKPIRQLKDAPLSRFILGLVNLKKPGNIGALLRTADATGFQTILLIDTSLDIYNPNVIRSSTGACFLDNIYEVTSEQAVAYLRANDYSIVAAVVDGDKTLFQADFSGRTAVILGTEDQGLDTYWVNHADQRVRIPMIGKIADSLNVSVSGAIFMVEALRAYSDT
ncbi:MAG: RNA methyltransferase [Phototrophicales bacterium]